MLSARDILSDEIIDPILRALHSSGVPKNQVFEIQGSIPEINNQIKAAAQAFSAFPRPLKLYFLIHMERASGLHQITFIRHEMNANGKDRSGIDHSFFAFEYRIIEGEDGKQRFRVNYLKMMPELRNFLALPSLRAILRLAKERYPGLKGEVRADNLGMGYMASAMLEEPRFIESKNPELYPVSYPLQVPFLEALQKSGILKPHQAQNLIELSISQGKSIILEQNIRIYNQLLIYYRENHLLEPSNENEVLRFFRLLRQSKMFDLADENPYQGDLWIEGYAPKSL